MKLLKPKYAIATILALVLFSCKKDGGTSSPWNEVGGKNTSTFNGSILSILSNKNNRIYAAGKFANGIGNCYIAVWDGKTWSELGGENTSPFSSQISSVIIDSNENIYAAGNFRNYNGNRYLAKWDGTSWIEVGGKNNSTFNGIINSITKDNKGNIYIAGNFRNSIGNCYVAKWDGISWSELGGSNSSTFNSSIYTITTDTTGNLYAGGTFTDSADAIKGKSYVAIWNGDKWSELGNITNQLAFTPVLCLNNHNTEGTLYAAGDFRYVAKWNGIKWGNINDNYITPIFNSSIYCFTTTYPQGNFYAGGTFTNANGKEFVAVWNGYDWSELGGSNTSDFNNSINSITIDSRYHVYAAGEFTNSKGIYYVAEIKQYN